MGLIKTGIKYGALFGIAREGMKAIDRHSSNQTPPQQSHSNQQLYLQPPVQRSTVDENGYAHQSWCNGACGGRCNGAASQYQAQATGRAIDNQAASYGNAYGAETPPAYQGQTFQVPNEGRRYITNEKPLGTV